MNPGESRTERLSFTLQPSIASKLKLAEPNISEYVWRLVTDDLKDRGLLTQVELKDIVFGDD